MLPVSLFSDSILCIIIKFILTFASRCFWRFMRFWRFTSFISFMWPSWSSLAISLWFHDYCSWFRIKLWLLSYLLHQIYILFLTYPILSTWTAVTLLLPYPTSRVRFLKTYLIWIFFKKLFKYKFSQLLRLNLFLIYNFLWISIFCGFFYQIESFLYFLEFHIDFSISVTFFYLFLLQTFNDSNPIVIEDTHKFLGIVLLIVTEETVGI
jgi:hypothetical protein